MNEAYINLPLIPSKEIYKATLIIDYNGNIIKQRYPVKQDELY